LILGLLLLVEQPAQRVAKRSAAQPAGSDSLVGCEDVRQLASEPAGSDREVGFRHRMAVLGERHALARRAVELLEEIVHDRPEHGLDPSTVEIAHCQIDEPRVAVEATRMDGDETGQEEELWRAGVDARIVVEAQEGEPELAPRRNGEHAPWL